MFFMGNPVKRQWKMKHHNKNNKGQLGATIGAMTSFVS